jgi:hypothetical protein
MKRQLKNKIAGEFQSKRTNKTTFLRFLLVLTLLVNGISSAQAANPASATISPTDTGLTWNGTATGGGALNGPEIGSEDLCQEGITCDTFTLTIAGAPADWAGKRAHIEINWLLQATDYDLYVHKDSNSGPVVANSGNGATNPTGPLTSEKVDLDPATMGTGVFTVHVVYYAATSADQYKGTVSVTAAPTPESTPTVSTEPAPRFFNYQAPQGMGQGAGEPTIGANWATGNAFIIAGLETLRISFDDSSSPAKASWTDVSAPNTSVTTLDPILFTDSDAGASRTNRLFVSQLAGKASLMAFSDDEGKTWTPSQGSGINSGVDHQTIGGGPYAKNADGTLKGAAVQLPGLDGKIYPNAIYYASQDIGLAEIARSDNGGLTFGVAVPMYNLTQCGGLHGHIKVSPDGTVYVPNKSCGGNQAVAVSEDNGLTWEVRKIPNSKPGDTDPSVGFGADGTVYFGYANGDGHARTAVSHDKGRTWVNDQDVGAQSGIQNTVFATIVGGDADRAAFFFLGTDSPGAAGVGDDSGAEPFAGVWYGYISTTYDGGKSWVTTNATPNDPVQRGVVCTNGTTCPSGTRNLLDFNDLTIDKQGRPLAVFADGCTSSACIQGGDKNGDGVFNNRFDNDGTEIGTIIRQSGGKTLFAAYDSANSNLAAAPMLTVSADTANSTGAYLNWSTPDNGGSVITGYKVYRGTNNGAAVLVATVGDVNSFFDASGSATNYYQVAAVNANGEGARSAKAAPVVIVKASACQLPGVTAVQDSSDAAPNAPAAAQVNINTLSIAEPYDNGVNKLVLTLKVGAGALPANSQWYVIWNRTTPDANYDRNYVAMKTNLSGVASFEHGRVSYPLVYTAPAANQGNLPTKFGSITGAYDAATGIVTMTVTNDKIDNIAAGQSLQSLEVRTFLARADGLPINQNLSSDFAAGSSYELVGNASCQMKPATPTGLTAAVRKVSGKNEVALAWKDNSNNEQNFVVERSTSVASGFAEIGRVSANANTFTDQSVARKTTYYYRVRAVNQNSSSDYSNTTSAGIK